MADDQGQKGVSVESIAVQAYMEALACRAEIDALHEILRGQGIEADGQEVKELRRQKLRELFERLESEGSEILAMVPHWRALAALMWAEVAEE